MMLESWPKFGRAAGALCYLLCAACDEASGSVEGAREPAVSASTDGGPRHDAALKTDMDDSLAACAAMGGQAPRTIADVVARVNALPPPATVACLIASLPRPLSLVASTSPSSLQPAGGPQRPRIFVMSDTLTLSVVAGGEAEHLVEFGQWVSPVRTLKGELAFPFERPLADDAPYKHLLEQEGATTACRLCHTGESAHETIPNAFVSEALRVATYYELPIDRLRSVRDSCGGPSGDDASARCAILRALFDHGEVRQGAFDEAVRPGF